MKKQRSQERWKKELITFKDSGLSFSRYCKENNINPSSFMYWKKKYDTPGTVETKKLVKISASIEPSKKMKLVYDQVTVEFPVELSIQKISQLITALKEV